MIERNLLLYTDSYKHSHWLQLPSDATMISEYLESRGGVFPSVRFFGLQSIIKRYLMSPFSFDSILEAESLINAHMGDDVFNGIGWRRLFEKHHGRLPILISAVPEGTDVPTHNVLMQVVNTDPEFAWLPTFLETILQQIWAPTTVCTLSAQVRRILERDLKISSDTTSAELGLQDFGLRGVATMDAGALLGLAHLVNFKGTDTLPALQEARDMYNATDIVGYSIPAGEHSEILAWGRDGEADYFAHLFDCFLKPGRIVAAPIDTYDFKYCVQQIICRRFRDRIRDSGGTYVARPDSGDPTQIVPWVLRRFAVSFGSSVNSKGFRVLHPSIRVIFGDGMTLESIENTNKAVMAAGFSTENVTYGMGGGLLQKINRDTQRFAIKASAVQRKGHWQSIRKTISSDLSKASKSGRLALIHDGFSFRTVSSQSLAGRKNLLRPIYCDGKLLIDETFPAIRARAALNSIFYS